MKTHQGKIRELASEYDYSGRELGTVGLLSHKAWPTGLTRPDAEH